MEKQRLISDARRRAKALSRADGRPHQTHLDEIARSAGRADWDAFLADPTPLASIETQHGDATEPANNDPYASYWVKVQEGDHGKGLTTQMIGLAILAAIISLANTRLVTIPIATQYRELIAEVMTIIVMAAFSLLAIPGITSIMNLVIATAVAWRNRPGLPIRSWARIWSQAIMKPALAAGIFAGFITFGQNMMIPVPPQDSQSIYEDMRTLPRIRMEGSPRSVLVGSLPNDKTKELSVVVLDQRMLPHQFRHKELPKNAGGKEMSKAILKHPVLRFVGDVECRDGSLLVKRVEASDTAAGKAAQVHVVTPRNGKRPTLKIQKEDLPQICAQRAT